MRLVRNATYIRFGLLVAAINTASAIAPTGAEAAPPVIEKLRFITVYQPPGGGPVIRRSHEAKPAAVVSQGLNVDHDLEEEILASVSLGMDPTQLKVAGRVQFARKRTVLGTLEPLELAIEAVAVLKKEPTGKPVVREHVSLGYDTIGSTAPERFTLDLDGCEAPDCDAPPTSCTGTCEGGRTTMSMNVVAPGPSLTLTGELAEYGSNGGRLDPLRGEIKFTPVPGNSSPLKFSVWSSKTPPAAGTVGPTSTFTQLSMNGNKEALRADALVCHLPGETYEPQQLGHDACDAAEYQGKEFDSRVIDADVDQLPRDVAAGNAGVTVSLADNGLGRNGGLQAVDYDATHEIALVDVFERARTWSDGVSHTADRDYELRKVPTDVRLELRDTTTGSGFDANQEVAYTANANLQSFSFESTEREGNKVTKREGLLAERVPTRFTIRAREGEERYSVPRLAPEGYGVRSTQAVELVNLDRPPEPVGPRSTIGSSNEPIGSLDYWTADGDTKPEPRKDHQMPAEYVFTEKVNGVQKVRLELLEVRHGKFAIDRDEHVHPFLPSGGGLTRLDVSGHLAPGPFRALSKDGSRSYDVNVKDLPSQVALSVAPRSGTIHYSGSAAVGEITVSASDPDMPLFKRANHLDVTLKQIPTGVGLRYPSDTNGVLDLKVSSGQIGSLELTARAKDDSIPADILDASLDGVVIRDTDDDYIMFGRVAGLRHVGFDDSILWRNSTTQLELARKRFALDVTSGRDFAVYIEREVPVTRHVQYFDSDEDRWRCRTGEDAQKKRIDLTSVVISGLAPATSLVMDKRRAYGERACWDNISPLVTRGPRYENDEVKDIRYTAGGKARELGVLIADGSTNLSTRLESLPTRLRFCSAPDGHECLPSIGQGYGTDMGSMTLDANDYVTVHLVDCQSEFENHSCETANTRISDLKVKQIDFWGDLDGTFDGTNGDIYMNTADYDYGVPTWNGEPWDSGSTNLDQPFELAASRKPARVKTDKADFRFGAGFFARAAHVYWDWIADDEISGEWNPTGAQARIHCPPGTFWEVDAGFPAGWVEVHRDWCTSGKAG